MTSVLANYPVNYPNFVEEQSLGSNFPWQLLPMEMKHEITRRMDFSTKRRFSFLSLETWNVCKKRLQLFFDSLEIVDSYWNRPDMPKFIKICATVKRQHCEQYTFRFIDRGFVNCEVEKIYTTDYKNPRTDVAIYNGENFKQMAFRFLSRFLKENRFDHVEYMTACTPCFMSKFVCKSLTISTVDEATFKKVLNLAPSHLSKLSMQYLSGSLYQDRGVQYFKDSDVFDLPQVSNTLSLNVTNKCSMNDDQFLRLKSDRIDLTSDNITENAINMYLKDWINGVRGNLEYLSIRCKEALNSANLLKDIDFIDWETVRRRNGAFATEFEARYTNDRLQSAIFEVSSKNSGKACLIVSPGHLARFIVTQKGGAYFV
ncbi:unnamed protein product [Caenorhabditis auriculariae]|uniref:Sdz-33 F-box domain-containing protein n=1 Tax=Caenorhabditis auriculariae TaxID=2777116 RepID=A0A8S1HXL6_9PELO|nr:unnamed protein product [Caenorhabditis auriculariae]